MNELQAIDVAKDALWVLVKVSAPLMLIALIVGLIISLFQALTQIQEMTLSFVPKMLAIFMSLLLLLPFIYTSLRDLNERMAQRIIQTE
ncbi:MAG: flagellar biosynthesis protein FliQ [Alphaproteobacteria bacterium]|nr:flagellar biosynthesis protein FliQ [Alphaproteobacteria bacterium]